MNRYPLWRYALLVVLIVLAIIYALPNLYGEDPAIQISTDNGLPVSVQVQASAKNALDQQNISYKSIESKGSSVLIHFYNPDTQLKAQEVLTGKLGNRYTIALNLASRTPKWLLAIGAHPMKLGLDLRGGVHFTLAVDLDSMLVSRAGADMQSMLTALRGQNIRYTRNTISAEHQPVIVFADQAMQTKAITLLNKQFGGEYKIVAENQGNDFQLRATIRDNVLASIQSNAIEQNMTILRNRVNALGVSEAVVQRQGLDRISVDLPGIQDTARAKDLIGKVATVRFQLVDEAHNPQAALGGAVPLGSRIYRYQSHPILLKNRVVLRGDAITSASTSFGNDGRPAVSIRLSGTQSVFSRITAENIGKRMATVYVETKVTPRTVNGKTQLVRHQIEKIISIATIQSALGNSFQITGLESQRYAENLALQLRSGAYSAPVTFIQERLVGPSLGEQNIRTGILSTEIGSLVVIIFMIFYYRLFGVFADFALLLNIVFIVAAMSIIGATMTLPGIAAIVLTVGMAVDANVLINERIREELRLGMSPQAAIHVGYDRAFSTIVDANVTTLIVAVVLVTLGSSSVKGFAISLIIGLIMSMITAIFFTRALVNLVYGTRRVKSISIGIKNPVKLKIGNK
jgi:preprotein translocase subunit SecD